MPLSTTFQRRRLNILFPCLLAAGALGIVAVPARCQPPAPRTERLIESVETDWQNLRKEIGEQEFLDPQTTITRYQKFYETEGIQSGQTAVEITGVIAQLYWQGLHNPQKALSIYDCGLKNFTQYPGYANLRKGRAAIEEAGKFENSFDVAPIVLGTHATDDPKNTIQPIIIGSPTKVLLPDATAPQHPGQTPPLAAIVLNAGKTPENATAPTDNPFAPVILTPPAKGETANAQGVIPAITEVGKAEIHADGKSTFSPVTVTSSDSQTPTKVLSPVQPNSPSSAQRPGSTTVLSPITAPPPFVKQDTSLIGIDPRQLQLRVAVVPLREGKMSIETFLSHDKPTAQEALWLLSAPRVIVDWNRDRPLRLALIGVIERENPQLLQTSEKLAPVAQLALGEYYAKQRDPKAVDVYKTLLSQNPAPNSGTSQNLVMNNLAEVYGAMGEYVKAAQTKLAIQKLSPNDFWIGNTNVEAARFYLQAGETEKAQALYKKAEKSTYAWAAGMAFVDEGKMLIAQGEYDEAIKVLSLTVEGSNADQVRVGLLSTLGNAYLQKGDVESARRVSQQAVDAYQKLANPLRGEGLQDVQQNAEQRVHLIDE